MVPPDLEEQAIQSQLDNGPVPPGTEAKLSIPAGREPGDSLAEWEELQRRLQEQGVQYCLASYVDVHGVPKAKSVPVNHVKRMLSGSELFTGAAIDGLGQGPQDDELSLWPDVDAVTVMPWEPTVAWAPGCLHLHGSPYQMDSRVILKQQTDRLRERGLILNLGIETEFFLVDSSRGRPEPANPRDVIPRAAYDVAGLVEALPFLDELAGYMNQLGWDVHSFDHEDANSQFEFDFSYTDALAMADRATLWKLMTKLVARRHDLEVTYMPKPYADRTGSGGHFNMSLATVADGTNLFATEDDARGAGVSELAYQFIGGLIQHAGAICAVASPTVNSYKRLVKTGSMTGYTWAPVYISYGANNRTHMFRVPMGGGRVECRSVDMSCNPYLTAAMMVGAGIDGIDRQLDPGDPIAENMYQKSAAELEGMGVKVLPRTLLEAVEAFDRDAGFTRDILGDELAEEFSALKQKEWWSYHNSVTDWEYDHYLHFF